MSCKVFKVDKNMGDLTFHIGDKQERSYVKIPVNKVRNAHRRKCKFVGALKCWETNVKTLTKFLDSKRKSPINFCDEGLCWTFYFDEAEGALYNEVDDEIPILKLEEYMPQQELNHTVDKTDKSICVQTLVREADNGSDRQEKHSKMKKAVQIAKSSKTNTSVATVSGTSTAQEQEKKKALCEMKKKAEVGDLDSMCGLGMCYVNEGVKWLQEAAKKNHQQSKEQLNRWQKEAWDDKPEVASPAATGKKDEVGTKGLTYEQIVEQAERLKPFMQYHLAKLCLEKASERGHKYARKMTEQWDCESEGEKKGNVAYFVRAENTTWEAVVAEAPDTWNSVSEEVSGEWVHTANGVSKVTAPGYLVWERVVLPLGVSYTNESGHEVVADAIFQGVHMVSGMGAEKRSWLVCLIEKWKNRIRGLLWKVVLLLRNLSSWSNVRLR